MASFGFLIIVVGFLYGALKKGRQDKGKLFRDGLLVGVILAVLVALLGAFFGPIGLIVGTAGAIGIILTAIILSLLFILGVWLGDLVTGAKKSA